MHANEDPRAAAQRELREELGLELPLQSLRHADQTTGEWDFRRDTVDIFEVVLDAEPRLTIDNREIVGAKFLSPEMLLGLQPAPFIVAYLLNNTVAPVTQRGPAEPAATSLPDACGTAPGKIADGP